MTRLKLYTDPKNPIFVPGKYSLGVPNPYEMHDMFAILEKDKWEFVDDISKADVIPCLFYRWDHKFAAGVNQLVRRDQTLLVMNLFHNDNFMTKNWLRSFDWDIVRSLRCRTLIVHNNNLDTADPKYIFYDILFNRQKYYFFDMDKNFDPSQKVWTRMAKREFYTFGPIDKQLSPESKKFLCLNRLYWEEHIVREQKTLRQLLKDKFMGKNDVFLSDPTNNIFFYPNHAEDNKIDVTQSSGTWYPAADFYYNNSYVSVYIESVVKSSDGSEIFCSTEKTLDPLLKGNFILPFSNHNFISGLRKFYGFRFPDWIDYSYDEIEDFDERMLQYSKSVDKLYNTPIEVLHQHYIDDKNILEHNRQVIRTLPYSSLYDSVVRSRNAFDWN